MECRIHQDWVLSAVDSRVVNTGDNSSLVWIGRGIGTWEDMRFSTIWIGWGWAYPMASIEWCVKTGNCEVTETWGRPRMDGGV